MFIPKLYVTSNGRKGLVPAGRADIARANVKLLPLHGIQGHIMLYSVE